MSDIFEEVDESLRQDKIESLWKRYRPFVYGGVVLIVGAVAVNEFVIHPAAEKARAARAMEFETAEKQLEDGNYADAETSLRAIVDGDSALSPLAANYLAQTLYEGSGDAAGAEKLLEETGKADGTPFQRIALLKAAYAKADKVSIEELETLLGSLTEENSALGALARELIAAKAYADGDIARARTAFNRLKFDAAAPEGVVRRADIALAAIPTPPAEDTGTAGDAAPETATDTTEETGE